MCSAFVKITVFCFIVIQLMNSGATRADTATTSDCRKPKHFRCKSGQCIDSDNQCDGTAHCDDASDETGACKRLTCPPFLFTCEYGACIDKSRECDGKPDCRDGSDERTPNCAPDETSPECQKNQFRCRSGNCIHEDFKCDGTAECDDLSDETREACWNVPCPSYTYRCKYGACVNGNARCNGTSECIDGSDENPVMCKKPQPTTPPPPPPPQPPTPGISGPNCIPPEHPKHGEWSYFRGSHADNGAIISIKCDKGYKLYGNNVIYCNNGSWSAEVGECLKVCPNILSTPTMKVTCVHRSGKETENCTDSLDGTTASFTCRPFYEDESLKRHATHVCTDGTWDYPTPQCEPICGQKTVDPTTLIVRGQNVTKGDYPWQVAIYTRQEEELICGGSLLNQRVVLTAAHCVTAEKGVVMNGTNYIVAAGKYYRPFNDSRDFNEAQKSEVEHVFVPEQYRGELQNFVGDIAILVTRKTFALSRRIQPVCIDKSGMYDPKDNEYGYVTGWGFTKESHDPSETLKELKIPSVSRAKCEENAPKDFEVFITYDKMCAGYLDNSTSVCKGDSGGGLVFKHEGRYYVTGIVSLSPNSPTPVGGCDSQQYGYFTKVSYHMAKFVFPMEAKYRPKIH